MASCYKCSKPILAGVEGPVPQDAVCDQCSSYLHCCANCTHFDEYSHSKCRESRAEYVFDRLGKNACSWFRLKAVVAEAEQRQKRKLSPRMEQNDREGRARENLAKLFR